MGVGIASSLASLAAKEAVQVRSLLVSPACLDSVALRALGLKDLGSLCDVSHFKNLVDAGDEKDG